MNNTASNMNQIPTGSKIDFQSIIQRAKDMCTNPDATLDVVKNENKSVTDIYKNYLIFLAAISPIANWIKSSLIGFSAGGLTVRLPIFTGLIQAVLEYAVSLAMIYVAAIVMEKIAPKFEGTANSERAFKLLAYSMTPGMLAGAFLLLPVIGWLVMLAGGVYGIYIFYNNFSKFIDVPQSKRPIFIVLTIVCMAVINIVAYSVISFIAPIQSATIDIGNQRIDLDKMEEGLKQWEKILPKP